MMCGILGLKSDNQCAMRNRQLIDMVAGRLSVAQNLEESRMITIHHLLVSQSERVIWLMEELGLPYELKSYPRQPNYMAAVEFSALHPVGQAPVIEDGDVVLAESLAIVTYILELYGNGALRIAPGEKGYADYLYWMAYSIGGLAPQAMQYMTALRMGTESGPFADMAQERRGRHLGMIDKRLAENEWLAGETFTGAEIMCQFYFGTMAKFGALDISGYPNIGRWLGQIAERPAFQRAMKIAGNES
jgi:glutathione S-transferase